MEQGDLIALLFISFATISIWITFHLLDDWNTGEIRWRKWRIVSHANKFKIQMSYLGWWWITETEFRGTHRSSLCFDEYSSALSKLQQMMEKRRLMGLEKRKPVIMVSETKESLEQLRSEILQRANDGN
jgi:hypothetical protein